MYRKEIIFDAGYLQVNEVVIDEEDGIPMGLKVFLSYLYRFGVGIKAELLSSGGTAFQNCPSMSDTTHRAINVAASGLDRQRLHCLFKQNRGVI